MTMKAKRRVRLHLQLPKGQTQTVEGLQVGRRPIGGHYVLLTPKIIESAETSISVDGHLEVPAERVIYLEVLG